MKGRKICALIVTLFIAASVVGCSSIVPYGNGGKPGIENEEIKNNLNIYKVTFDKKANKLDVVVTNPLKTKVNLTFGSTQEYDFILYKDGKQVYKWSQDKAFGKMIVKREIGPKGSLKYSLDLSSLSLEEGQYKYEFYSVANELKDIPHKTGVINIGKENNNGNGGIAYYPLKYEVKNGNDDKLVIEVRNQNEKPITLTYTSGQMYDIKFYQNGKHVYTWSQDKNFIQMISEKTIIQGESEIYEVNLDELTLPKGEYQYEFYSVAKELSNVPVLKGKITIK